MRHLIRPDGMPPTNGYSHAVAVFLTDLADLAAFRAARDEFVSPERPPASSLVQVSGLVHPAIRVEIEAVAAVS